MEHPETIELIECFDSSFDAARRCEIEEHFAACTPCAEIGRQMFSTLCEIEELNSRGLASAFLWKTIAAIPDSTGAPGAAAKTSQFALRLLRRFGESGAGVLHAVVDTAGAAFRLGHPRADLQWAVTPAYALRGAEEPGSSEYQTVLVKPKSWPEQVAVSIDRAGNGVTVKMQKWSAQETPLVMLLDPSRPAEVAMGRCHRTGEQLAEAFFEDVKPGSYLVFLAEDGGAEIGS